MKSKRAKATDIPQAVRIRVYDRDDWKCIFCGRPGYPNCHVINRSQGGLGIEQNIVTACAECHFAMDNGRDTEKSRRMKVQAENYLKQHYKNWRREDCIYDKWKGVF